MTLTRTAMRTILLGLKVAWKLGLMLRCEVKFVKTLLIFSNVFLACSSRIGANPLYLDCSCYYRRLYSQDAKLRDVVS